MAQIGLQLFTVKERAQEDLLGTLRSVGEIGYRGVEFAGLHGNEPAVIRTVLNEAGLVTAATHVMAQALDDDMDREVATCRTLGCPTVICPFIPRDERRSRFDWSTVAQRFNRIGRRLNDEGIRFLYHHHGFDFEPLESGESGETGFQILVEETDPRYVGFELDAYWLEVGGVDAVSYYTELHDRVPSLHLKNMRSRDDHHDVELADGVIDIPGLVVAAKRYGADWIIVEQERFDRDPLESVRLNYQQLTSMTAAV